MSEEKVVDMSRLTVRTGTKSSYDIVYKNEEPLRIAEQLMDRPKKSETKSFFDKIKWYIFIIIGIIRVIANT